MGQIVIIMGVSGCGKSTIGKQLASGPTSVYIEGDELHPTRNIEKMSKGKPLDDDDRWPWFDEIIQQANRQFADNELVLVGCSALKESYRSYLTEKLDQPPRFIHLAGSFETIHERMKARQHFMPANLLKSQFEALEIPDYSASKSLTLAIESPIDEMVASARKWLQRKD